MIEIHHRNSMQKFSSRKILVSVILAAILATWIAVIMCPSVSFQNAYAQAQNKSFQTPSSANQSLRIAYLTDGLFSDAGWGRLLIMRVKK
ncbi:MAG TPA: hypothetical protein VLD84_00415 [Nitrososphaeraceae archaeon]|nr:hypothetical protein [Nitrososphaeraceae archaeon]